LLEAVDAWQWKRKKPSRDALRYYEAIDAAFVALVF
jgi:hypothetical protein